MIELVRRDALDAVAVPNKTSLVNQRDDDPGDSSHEDIAGEQRPRCKSAQLGFVVAIEAGKLLLDIRQNRRTRARGQCRRRQHLIDRAGGQARGLVVRLRTAQAVLRESPSAFACSSSVTRPSAARAEPSSLILIVCRALLSAILLCAAGSKLTSLCPLWARFTYARVNCGPNIKLRPSAHPTATYVILNSASARQRITNCYTKKEV